jgi:DNA-binding NtrC family response regulator
MSDAGYGDLSLLVVDDEPIVCRSLARSLGKIGFSVETVDDPERGLALVGERSFDIVITDIVMGDVDGIQILTRVLEHSPRTKVIIITAFATREIAREAMARGAFDFIAKPFRASEIRELVTRAAQSLR